MKRALWVLVVAGCGGVGRPNTLSCEGFVATFQCGYADVSFVTDAIDCAEYEDRVCDFSVYFQCLSDGYTCDEASSTLTADPDKLATCPEGPDCE